ncbi:hypothetical protein MXB_1884, partial [Myxobolus squamalis]
SIRLSYINKLKNYFTVHGFGNCFNFRISAKSRIKSLSKYKFLLSFENSHCEEYNTEKYWDGIRYGAVPVVMSYNDNLTNLVPGSFINVFDFLHPRNLAIYLKLVSSNFDEYKKYFNWKGKHSIFFNKFKAYGCKFLCRTSKLLLGDIVEDPTIKKIGNFSVCVDPQTVYNLILKN